VAGLPKYLKFLVPAAGLEPARPSPAKGF